MGSLPFLCLEYEVLDTGHLHCKCPANLSTTPNVFWMLHQPGVWVISASCLLEGGRRQILLTPLLHCYSIHKIFYFLGQFCGSCSQAANPEVPAFSSAGLNVIESQKHNIFLVGKDLSDHQVCTAEPWFGFSSCSAPESPSFSLSAIRSWALAYLISSLFSEIYLC